MNHRGTESQTRHVRSSQLIFRSMILWLGASVVQLGTSAFAQELKSRPVGFVSLVIPPGQTRSFSVPFDADVSNQAGAMGHLTAVGVNYLGFSAALWTPGAFSNPLSPYFVRLMSGVHAGRTFRVIAPENTATRLYVANDDVDLTTLGLITGTNGIKFEIIPDDTLATFFGTDAAGDTLVVQGASNPEAADVIQVWGGASWLNFYYNTSWHRWVRDTDSVVEASRNGYLLRSDRGLMITRRGSTPLELAVTGRVLVTPQRALHTRTGSALSFLATMQASDITLGALALQLSSRSLAWRGAADSAEADRLLVWGGAAWFTFFYNSAAGHWQRVGDPADRDSFVIAAGVPVFVQRVEGGHSVDDKTITFPVPGS